MSETPASRPAPSRTPWLVCRRPRPGAIGLYCFAHCGGTAGEFARWADELPDAEVRAVQLPGRGSRIDEPVLTSMQSLVAALLAHLDFDGRFVFFGHSLGALVAFEVARGLRDRGRAQPERLFLSASPAPHLPRTLPPVHHLDDQDLLAAITDMYGTLPAALKEDPELLRLMMVPHRADFRIVETYQYLPGAPLDIPLHVVTGREDRHTAEQMTAWSTHSRVPVDLHPLPGGHFYLREQRSALLAHLRARLTETTGTPERQRITGRAG
ncbi:thioesterase II family protein [Streptomyces sp. B3I8]|uniref:thioesterase II family protein n=1 Tax=Streptomyces sp. B3I8 TaxID=3042303 RepID=UPI00277F3D7A|nr:alpha/beta fold hydrolase [Streptomyces sp. B3I8]MDQ0786683.1 surfactin synthase thioesterase subunit [Streptomyces sp. B3I8]